MPGYQHLEQELSHLRAMILRLEGMAGDSMPVDHMAGDHMAGDHPLLGNVVFTSPYWRARMSAFLASANLPAPLAQQAYRLLVRLDSIMVGSAHPGTRDRAA